MDTDSFEPATPCEEYGHDYDTDPEDIMLHTCTQPGCRAWYRDTH